MPISYTPTAAFGTAGTYAGGLSYKEITVAAQVGDLLVAWGGSEAAQGADSQGAITTAAGSTGTTNTWTHGASNDSPSSCGYTMGHTVVTGAGDIVVRVNVPAQLTGSFVGAGVWLVPAAEWTGTPAYTIGDVNAFTPGIIANPAVNPSWVMMGVADWSAQNIGTSISPAGGTNDTNYFDSLHWGASLNHWTNQPTGIASFGPDSPSGDQHTGGLVVVQQVVVAPDIGFLQLENFGNLLLEDNINAILI